MASRVPGTAGGRRARREVEHFAELANLVFEEVFQRLDDAAEAEILRQSADVVVAFDDRRFVFRLDDVGIYRALREESVNAERLARARTCARTPRRLSFVLLRLRHAAELREEIRLRVDGNKIEIEFRERLFDRLRLRPLRIKPWST